MPIPQHFRAAAKAEYDRMIVPFPESGTVVPTVPSGLDPLFRPSGYLLAECVSPYATQWFVVKKGKPDADGTYKQVRAVCNYVWLNEYTVVGQYPHKNVIHTLTHISGYHIFASLDLMNAFHQVPISERASYVMALVTPYSQCRPLFLPEGISCAPAILQSWVSRIVATLPPMGDGRIWCEAIHDNILVMAMDFDDMFKKLRIFFDCAARFNLILKLSKCEIGVRECEFFGYRIRAGSYTQTPARVEALRTIPFPHDRASARSLIGALVFMSPHTGRYSELVGPLHDLTKAGFTFDRSTWKRDYVADLDAVKAALTSEAALYYPDFNKEFRVYADSSDDAIAGILYQVDVRPDGTEQFQTLSLQSKLLSAAARRWDIPKKEMFAVWYTLVKCFFLLHGKSFVLYTDHSNLRQMEKLQSPFIQRMVINLKTLFDFKVNHVAGKDNHLADYLSRPAKISNRFAIGVISLLSSRDRCLDSYCRSDLFLEEFHCVSVAVVTPASPAEQDGLTARKAFQDAHVFHGVHQSAARTWSRLHELHPQVTLPFTVTRDLVEECAFCAKVRRGLDVRLPRHVLSTAPPEGLRVLGSDWAPVSPKGDQGCTGYYVMVLLHSKLCMAVPRPSKTLEDLGAAFFRFVCTYGTVDELRSDQGSEYTAEFTRLLCQLFKVTHVLTSIGVHTGSAVEGHVKIVKEACIQMALTTRAPRSWDSDEQTLLVNHVINSTVSLETGFSPYELTFGSPATLYQDLPETPTESAPVLLARLNSHLHERDRLRLHHQQNLRSIRERQQPSTHTFAPGDYVLLAPDPTALARPTTLTPRFSGPWCVASHVGNDVSIDHPVTKLSKIVDLSRCKLFAGSPADAYEVAKADDDQHTVLQVYAWRGDPYHVTSVEFELLFADGTVLWVPWSTDLKTCSPVTDYIDDRPMLRRLRTTQEVYAAKVRLEKSLPVTTVQPGDRIFVDCRFWYGPAAYAALDLPDCYRTPYFFEMVYGVRSRSMRVIDCHCEVLCLTTIQTNLFVYEWGSVRSLPVPGVLITWEFLSEHRQLLPTADLKQRTKILKHLADIPASSSFILATVTPSDDDEESDALDIDEEGIIAVPDTNVGVVAAVAVEEEGVDEYPVSPLRGFEDDDCIPNFRWRNNGPYVPASQRWEWVQIVDTLTVPTFVMPQAAAALESSDDDDPAPAPQRRRLLSPPPHASSSSSSVRPTGYTSDDDEVVWIVPVPPRPLRPIPPEAADNTPLEDL